MVSLYLQKNTPFNAERFLGVVITGSEDQRHTGILYRTTSGSEVNFLHLGFHYQLLHTRLRDDYCWLPLDGFEDEEQLSLAIWFESIWKRNGERIPYGINFSRSRHFNNSGAFTASYDDGGLTCATFVLSIFEDFGYSIIDTATSYRRDSDIYFQEKIIELLKSSDVSNEYIQAQTEFIGVAARYRPEEVAGAASALNGSPFSFDAAIALGDEVLQKMRSIGALS